MTAKRCFVHFRNVLVAVGLPLLLLDAVVDPALAKKAKFMLEVLPEEDGIASKATGLHGSGILCGMVFVADQWRPAVWDFTPELEWQLNLLPDDGMGGYVRDIRADPPGSHLHCVGATYGTAGELLPTVWERLAPDNPFEKVMLTLPEGFVEGEARSLRVDPGEDIFVGGRVYDANGASRACVWSGPNLNLLISILLPSLAGGNTVANDFLTDNDGIFDLIAIGSSTNGQGQQRAVRWGFLNDTWVGPFEFPTPDGSGDSTANAAGSNPAAVSPMCAVGTVELPGGSIHAYAWDLDDDGSEWIATDLGVLPGHENSRAFGLSDLSMLFWGIVGFSASGAGTAEATLWEFGGDEVYMYRLEDQVIAGNDSLILRQATDVAPGGQIAGFGENADPPGTDPHAFVLVPCGHADADCDGDVDIDDYAGFANCMAGPGAPPDPSPPLTPEKCIALYEWDFDGDLDAGDFAGFMLEFTGAQ
jgi:hypothetical protein